MRTQSSERSTARSKKHHSGYPPQSKYTSLSELAKSRIHSALRHIGIGTRPVLVHGLLQHQQKSALPAPGPRQGTPDLNETPIIERAERVPVTSNQIREVIIARGEIVSEA